VEVCEGLLKTAFELRDVSTVMRLQTKTSVALTRSRMALLGGQTSKGLFQFKLIF